MRLRPATAGDLPAVLRLNTAWQHVTSPLDARALAELHGQAAYHRVLEEQGEVVAFLLALPPGQPYESPNYRWFDGSRENFLYIDRVVVAADRQRSGAGGLLYEDLLEFAEQSGVRRLVCEVDVEPLNAASDAFHARLGFVEVGTQWVASATKRVSLRERVLGWRAEEAAARPDAASESFEDKLRRVLGERIEIVEYDPRWSSVFEAEAARLRAFFPPGTIQRVEHIGSTAVPGLAAKPIVDILAGVDDFALVTDHVVALMEAAGYDYFLRPAFGDSGPRYPWFIGRDREGRRISHLHVALVDDRPQWDRIVFRDYLRSHPDTAREYAALKRDLAARFAADREAYTWSKTAFVAGVLSAAHNEATA